MNGSSVSSISSSASKFDKYSSNKSLGFSTKSSPKVSLKSAEVARKKKNNCAGQWRLKIESMVCYCSFAGNNHCVFLLRTQQQPLRIFTTRSATPGNNHCVFLLRTQQHPPLRIFATHSATPGNNSAAHFQHHWAFCKPER